MVTRDEEALVAAFVDLSARPAGAGAGDVDDTLRHLAVRCVALLGVDWAGVFVGPDEGSLGLRVTGGGHAAFDAVLAARGVDGPWREASRRHQAVGVADLDREVRWPRLRVAAAAAGLRTMHALPLRHNDEVLGVLCVADGPLGPMKDDDLFLAAALGRVAAVAMVNSRTASDLAVVNAQLQHALESRVAVEQATGMLAQASGLDIAAAFAVLRIYARSHRRRLHDVAHDVVGGVVPVAALVRATSTGRAQRPARGPGRPV